MVNISSKAPTTRKAVAKATLHFSNSIAAKLIAENGMKKGDVLGVARIAGIMASKKCSDLIPLCHPIMITKVAVECELVLPKDASKMQAATNDGARESREEGSFPTKFIGPGHTLAADLDRSGLDNPVDNSDRVRGIATNVDGLRHGREGGNTASPILHVGSRGAKWVRSSALSAGVDGDFRDALSHEATAEDCRDDVAEVAANRGKQTAQEGQDIPKGKAEVVPEAGAKHHRVDAADVAPVGIRGGHKAVRVGGAHGVDMSDDWGRNNVGVGRHLEKNVRDDVEKDFGHVEITATVQCEGKTGVEMEALTAVTVAALTVYDMCKAVDKHMRIDCARVVRKEGGKSGDWSSE